MTHGMAKAAYRVLKHRSVLQFFDTKNRIRQFLEERYIRVTILGRTLNVAREIPALINLPRF